MGLDAIDGSHFRLLNADDHGVAIDPLTYAARLEAAGLVDVSVDLSAFPRFLARA